MRKTEIKTDGEIYACDLSVWGGRQFNPNLAPVKVIALDHDPEPDGPSYQARSRVGTLVEVVDAEGLPENYEIGHRKVVQNRKLWGDWDLYLRTKHEVEVKAERDKAIRLARREAHDAREAAWDEYAANLPLDEPAVVMFGPDHFSGTKDLGPENLSLLVEAAVVHESQAPGDPVGELRAQLRSIGDAEAQAIEDADTEARAKSGRVMAEIKVD